MFEPEQVVTLHLALDPEVQRNTGTSGTLYRKFHDNVRPTLHEVANM